MYTLYSIAGTCSTGITVLLEKMAADFKVVQRDDTPNYKEIVATNQVPALELENGQIITEGAAIALYLLEKHDAAFYSKTAEEKAEFNRWLMFNYATLHPAYSKMFAINFKLQVSDEEKTKLLQQLADQTSTLWTIIDEHLGNQRFIMGDEPTIIDYLLTVYSSWNNNFPDTTITLGENVKRLINEVTALPEFAAAYERENKKFQAAA